MSFRTLWVLPGFIILTFCLCVAALGIAFFDSNGEKIHRIAVFWARMVLLMSGVRTRIFNPEVLDPKQSYIFAANHRSAYDIYALFSTLPIPFRWVAKDSYFKIPIFGWAMKGAGYISINRSNPKEAYQSLRQAAQRINEGTSVIIFPEGTRQKTDQLGEFKKGLFLLAMKSQRPIVPVAIQGSGRVLTKGDFWITPGTINIILGKPIPTDCYCNKKEVHILMKLVREAIEENLSKKYPESRSQESE